MIAQADRVLELGPHGGFNGGQLIYDGTPQNYPMRHIAGTPSSSPVSKPLIGWITVKNASLHTVIRQSFKLPLGHMTCFTGVSGSGKTTLLAGILLPALEQLQKGLGYVSSKVGEVACVGVGTFKLIYLPQSAIGGSYRSRVLTYIGLADSFREWFFQHSEAIESGLTISDFSANTLEGQCLTCEGLGRITSSSGSHEKCPSCCGSGFKPESTFVHTQNMSIEQWMECIFSDLAQNEGIPVQLRVAAELAIDLELGHLSLGRSIPTLSGGECQRLRIIKALLEARPRKNSAAQQHLIIIMDEPAAGLHAKDVQKLTKALKTHITDKGHTLLLVEHNLDLISQADWIVEVGPGSAAKGGKVLFADSMEKFFKATLPDSPTHSVLKDKLKCKSIGLLSKTIANAPTSTPDLVNMIKAVDRFKHYIKGESEEQDEFNPVIQPIAPAYLLNPNEFANQTLAHVIGLDASLARLFSVASSCEQQPILTDLTMLTNQALQLLKQGWRIGWFPSLNGHELTTWPDVVKAIQYHLQQKQEWFDGKQITIKSPKISEVKDINKVRLLLTSQLDKDEAVRRAISLGKGWVSFVSLETDEIRELSVRAIDSQHLRLGSRWQVPQIFDSAFIQNACPLCDGRGKMESVNEQLIFKDKSKSLEDDQLFQPYALEILKLARRRDMLPAAKRLKECRLIDLMAPQESMLPTEALAFWFGYPYKSFLKSDGDKNIRSNWYHWIGINKTVLLGMWKCSSRAWAEKVNSSRTEVKCPQCQGSGLGWEAQARKLSGVSLQDIYLNYTGLQLGSWLKKLQLESNMATQAQQEVLDVLSLIVKMTNKNFRLFELLSNLPEALQKAALNIYISNNKLNKAMVFMN
jgi:excinuclease ABC subunit A